MFSWLRTTLLLILSSFSLSLFFLIWKETKKFTFVYHVPDFLGPQFLLLFLFAFIFLSLIWFLFSCLIKWLSGQNLLDLLKINYFAFLPFLFFSFAPLTLNHYLTQQDTFHRLHLAFFLIIAFFFLIQFFFTKELLASLAKKRDFLISFQLLPCWKKYLILFLTAYFFFSLGAILIIHRGADFSGDEPHYLIIAHSLIVDHDLDLANNYDQRDYWQFLRSKAFLQPHTVKGAKPTSQLSFHSPGVAFVVLPFYWLGRFIGGYALIYFPRLAIAFFGALFCLQIYRLIKNMGWDEKLALKLWSISALTAPIYFYSFHIYPEIIIAFLSLILFCWLIHWENLKDVQFILFGLLLSSFFWFHAIKYFFILLPLGLDAFIKTCQSKFKFKKLMLLILSFFAGLISYFYFQKHFYGSLNPTSVSWQGAMGGKESLDFLRFLLFSIPFRFRWETLVGYFFDQRDGLFFYSPLYVLAFVGLIRMLQQKLKLALKIILFTWPYFLFSAFLTQRAGYAPQARPLVASFWGFSLFLGYFFLTNEKKWLNLVAKLAFIYSLVINVLLLLSPLNLYQETTAGTTERAGGVFLKLSHLHFSLPQILPSFLKIENSHLWWPNYFWLGLFFIFLVITQIKRDWRLRLNLSIKILILLACLFGLLFWFAYYPRLVLTHPVKKKWPVNHIITFYSLSRVAKYEPPGTFLLPQAGRPYHFWWTTSSQLETIEIEIDSTAGELAVDLLFFDYPLFQGKVNSTKIKLTLKKPPAYELGSDYLYWLRIELGPESNLPLQEKPLRLFFSIK